MSDGISAGARVIVLPADDLDPIANKYAGEAWTVRRVLDHSMVSYVIAESVKDNRIRQSFRLKDLELQRVSQTTEKPKGEL